MMYLFKTPSGNLQAKSRDEHEGGSTTTTWSPVGELSDHLPHLEEGGIVVDASRTGERGLRFLVDGPVVDLGLDKDEHRAFAGSDILGSGLSGQFKKWYDAADQKGWSGLDSVGIRRYATMWARYGAVWGEVVEGEVKWACT